MDDVGIRGMAQTAWGELCQTGFGGMYEVGFKRGMGRYSSVPCCMYFPLISVLATLSAVTHSSMNSRSGTAPRESQRCVLVSQSRMSDRPPAGNPA